MAGIIRVMFIACAAYCNIVILLLPARLSLGTVLYCTHRLLAVIQEGGAPPYFDHVRGLLSSLFIAYCSALGPMFRIRLALHILFPVNNIFDYLGLGVFS